MKLTQIVGPYPAYCVIKNKRGQFLTTLFGHNDVDIIGKEEDSVIKQCKTCEHGFDDGFTIECRDTVECRRYEKWKPKTTGPTDNNSGNPYLTQIGGNHYKEDYPFCEPLEFFSKNNIPATKAKVCKYTLRHDKKDGMKDLRKAHHILRVIAWDDYGEIL